MQISTVYWTIEIDRQRGWGKTEFFLICMNNNIIEVDITVCCPQTHSSSNLFQLRVNTLFSLAFALFAYIMEFCQAQTKMYDNDDGRGDNNYIVILMCKDSP